MKRDSAPLRSLMRWSVASVSTPSCAIETRRATGATAAAASATEQGVKALNAYAAALDTTPSTRAGGWPTVQTVPPAAAKSASSFSVLARMVSISGTTTAL